MSKRITRNSYKRKVILVGIMLFMAIALISTGFAAWVISTGASTNNAGGVEVGVVTGVDLKMELAFSTGSKTLVFSGNEGDNKLYYTKLVGEDVQADESEPFSFSFDTQESDTIGRVRFQPEGPGEILELKIAGTVEPGDFVRDVVITFKLPAGVVKAIKANYITFNHAYATDPETGEGIVTLTLTEENRGLTVVTQPGTADPVEPKTYSFEQELVFSWGTFFGEKNPGLYYDSDAGKATSTDDVIKNLNTLRAVIYGYDGEEGYQQYDANTLKDKKAPVYGLNITANIN